MKITKEIENGIKDIITASKNIENNVTELIKLLQPIFVEYEKPIEKNCEIKKEIMYCIEKHGINYNSDEHEQYYKLIDEMLTNSLLEETVNHSNYYKKILREDAFETFEKIITLLQSEIQFFYENLVYTQKIFDFINEFNRDGVFPTDLLFLKTFLATASSNMILIACKLFFVGSVDYKTKENICFNYLRQYIFDNAKDKDIVQTKLRNVKNSLKTIKLELLPLDELRNTYIAHYQMNKAPESIKIDINSLKKIYDVACELLEELSLMYFQGKDIGEYNFIRYQGFKKAICQNLIMDNIQKLDIEKYFDYLRCRQIL